MILIFHFYHTSYGLGRGVWDYPGVGTGRDVPFIITIYCDTVFVLMISINTSIYNISRVTRYGIREYGIRNTRYGQGFWTNAVICVNVVLIV